MKKVKKQSKTDWQKLKKMRDKEIDVSDIPPLDEKFFANAKLCMPKDKVNKKIHVSLKN